MKQQILLVEDNPSDVFLFEHALAEAQLDYELIWASDGERGMHLINGPGSVAPQLFLLDLNLPRISGIELLQHIRSQARFNSVPVMIWSSDRQPREASKFASLGVTKFLVKPSQIEEFFEIANVVRGLLKIGSA